MMAGGMILGIPSGDERLFSLEFDWDFNLGWCLRNLKGSCGIDGNIGDIMNNEWMHFSNVTCAFMHVSNPQVGTV